MTGSPDLEARYRRLLLAYPRHWRAEHGEELLAVLLAASQDAGRSRPGSAETIDLLAQGLATRVRAATRPFSADLRAKVAVLSLGSGAAMAAVSLLFGELARPGRHSQGLSYRSMTTFSPVLTVAALLYVAWLAVWALTVAGRLRPGRGTSLGLVALSAATALTSVAARSRPLAAPPLHLIVLFAAVGLLAGLGRIELTRRGRLLLALGSVGLAGTFGAVVAAQDPDPGIFDVEDPRWVFYRGWGSGIQGLTHPLWFLVGVTLLVAAVASRRRPGWFAAAAVAVLPWFCFSLLFVAGPTAGPALPALAVGGWGVAAGLVLVTRRAWDRWRRTA